MRTQGESLASARLAARQAHDIARAPLLIGVAFLNLVSSDPRLPRALRDRAREAAFRVAESAMHIEALRDALEMAGFGVEADGYGGPDLVE
jgi:hypothetical protein